MFSSTAMFSGVIILFDSEIASRNSSNEDAATFSGVGSGIC